MNAPNTETFQRLLFNVRNRHFLLLDLIVFSVTPLVAFWLRTEDVFLAGRFLAALVLYTLIAIVVRLAVLFWWRLYSRYWRYASVKDLSDIVVAYGLATTLVTLMVLVLYRVGPLDDFPRALPLVDGMLSMVLFGGLRLGVPLSASLRPQGKDGQAWRPMRIVLLGAGSSGSLMAKEMLANQQRGLLPVAFLDDDPAKRGMFISGVPVLGDSALLPDVVRRYGIEQAIIAMPSASGKRLRALATACQAIGLPVRTLPGIHELLSGHVAMNQLREVSINDLLRRESVATDAASVRSMLTGKCVLVTGAGGSIGSELCRQIARADPKLLVLLGHGEHSLYLADNELRRLFPGLRRLPVIADVRDAARLRALFERHRPEIVFHAAAHKHVPLMEGNVEEAISNNVQGTLCVLEAAELIGAERFVMVSTDKAVNPTSIMGASKRVSELLVQDVARRTGRRFVAVRFGNVLGSRGSVVPLFREQLLRGGPLTVTHPEMQRYFMTIPEAVELVLQAAALGCGGEIFVLDMGEPVRIVDLARDMIRLSGLEENRDVDIVYTGLRPGEKLFEELHLDSEHYGGTAHPRIRVALNGYHADLDSRRLVDTADSWRLRAQIEALISAARVANVREVRVLLKQIVPEYNPLST